MSSTARALSTLDENSSLSPAFAVEDERADGTVKVRPDRNGPLSIVSAQVAVSRAAPLCAGDRVLIAADSEGALYVVGRLGSFRPEPQSPATLQTGNGAFAIMTDSESGPGMLEVYSPRRELIFQYDPAGEKARVHVPRGSLELSTEEGDIELKSARNVRIGGRNIEMDSQILNVRAASARWVIDRFETVCETVVEKARNAYRTIEQLVQVRAGRMRTLVDQSYQFKSRKAYLKSEGDFKIKGEKIHLG